MPTPLPVDPLAHLSQALTLRLRRHEVLVGNWAHADTPGYQARDFDFQQALAQATQGGAQGLALTHPQHLGRSGDSGVDLAYRMGVQPAIDGNTVDPDLERSHVLKNAFMAEASMQFLGAAFRARLSAITGQPS